MQLALEWATANHPEHSLTICTGSQSLLKAIERQSPVTHYLRSLLNTRLGRTTLLWIPEHKGIPGNELADTEAKTAVTTTSDTPKPIFYASKRFLFRKALIDPPPANSWTAEAYGGFPWSNDCKEYSDHADSVLAAHLQAGHTPLAKVNVNLLDPLCPPLQRGGTGYRKKAVKMPKTQHNETKYP